MSKKRYNLLKGKILYTMIIILTYLICRNIPLYMIDMDIYMNVENAGGNLLLQTLGGDSPILFGNPCPGKAISLNSAPEKKLLFKPDSKRSTTENIFILQLNVMNLQWQRSGKENIHTGPL